MLLSSFAPRTLQKTSNNFSKTRLHSHTCAIIGGGPSGYYAAISLAERLTLEGKKGEITIYEGTGKTLQKVRISGGGRCNLLPDTSKPVRPNILSSYPRGSRELTGPMSLIPPSSILTWFNTHGVDTKVESDGRTFPISDSSETVINSLTSAASSHPSITIQLKTPVISLKPISPHGYTLSTKTSQKTYDTIILATGSSRFGYTLLSSLNHTIIPPLPSLFTMNCHEVKTGDLKDLAGSSLSNVEVTFGVGKKKLKTNGPMLITHTGLSGPAILKMSAYAARELWEMKYISVLKINFVHDLDVESLLGDYKLKNRKRKIRSATPDCLGVSKISKRLWNALLDSIDVKDKLWSEISNKEFNKLITQLTQFEINTVSKNTNKDEFVTAGGLDLKEVNFKNMESKLHKGLFIVGECLDVDAVTGGFNFLNCWVTGKIAGEGVGGYFREIDYVDDEEEG
ncbi:hypothetical protein TrLO_g4857 [Triparma laevis f. longispina]|uniref:Uncharacterized protein n=1 Tax=Triparma laevis f. longispina TaxID=1714387 RepID=A0A9W7E3U7_9STRA|nr:hypothetical protein TrLO_g4857 [Triparma laevis f. longispina]